MIDGFSTLQRENVQRLEKEVDCVQSIYLICIDLKKKKNVCNIKLPHFRKEENIYHSSQEAALH